MEFVAFQCIATLGMLVAQVVSMVRHRISGDR